MADSTLPEYVPFPDIARRNFMQETLEVPAVVHLLDLPHGQRILEVGCGRGVALPPLSALLEPARLTGLDVDLELISVAHHHTRERGVEVNLCLGDVRAMPFADASFDIVVDFGTCHHIAGPERALREIARVLAPGGCFVSETVTSQLLSHPLRSRARRLPWDSVPEFSVARGRLLWKMRRKASSRNED